MRTFIALNFKDDLRDRLGKIQKKLKTNVIKGSWVYIDNFHLTMKFLGNTNLQNVNNIKSILGEIAKNNPNMKLNLRDLGFFPGKDHLRVVWISLDGEIEKLEKLNNEIERKMNSIGFPNEKNEFKPHITLGRNITFNTPFHQIKDSIREDLNYSFTLDSIALMKSEEVERKRIYSTLAHFKLEG